MMPLLLALALCRAQVAHAPTPSPQQEHAERPRQSTYYWTDGSGRSFVTTVPPPPSATIIQIVAHPNDSEVSYGPLTPEEARAGMESVMDREAISYWHSIDRAFYQARLDGDALGQAKTVNGLFRKALWGDGLWAMPLLPFVIMAIFLLPACWVCIGLKKPARPALKPLIWATFAAAGLALSHIALQSALYRKQAKRLDFMLSMAPNYLGGHIEVKPKGQKAVRDRVQALLDAAGPTTPLWAFPKEISRAKQALKEVVAESRDFEPPIAEAPETGQHE